MATARPARILVLSVRRVRSNVFNSALYEFEDAICGFDRADLVAVRRHHGDLRFSTSRRLANAVRAVGLSSLAAQVPFASEFVPRHDYDLLFAVLDNPRDCALIRSIRHVRDRFAHIAVFVPEVWASTFEQRGFAFEDYGVVDRFFVGTWHDVDPLAEVTGVPTSYLAPALDTLRFVPVDPAPARVIDVVNLGRRSPTTHRALLDLARRGPFYFYDTVSHGQSVDPVAHREWLADLLRRSKYAITNYAKCNEPDVTGGRRDFGYRFGECAAAGCIMLGTPPDTPPAARLLGWPDAVVQVAVDAPDIAEVIASLESDPRCDEQRRRNVAGALRFHDVVDRWAEVLATFGLPPTPAMARRKERLELLAAAFDPDGSVPRSQTPIAGC